MSQFKAREVLKMVQISTVDYPDKKLFTDPIMEESVKKETMNMASLAKTTQFLTGIVLLKLEDIERTLAVHTKLLDKGKSKENEMSEVIERLQHLDIATDLKSLKDQLVQQKPEQAPTFGWMTKGGPVTYPWMKPTDKAQASTQASQSDTQITPFIPK